MEIPSSFNSKFEKYQQISAAGSSKSEMMQLVEVTGEDSEEKLEVAAREFTGMFLGQMLKNMRSTVELCELGHAGQAEETFQSMLDDEWAKNIAYQGGIDKAGNGIVGVVHNSLKQRAVTEAYNNAVVQ